MNMTLSERKNENANINNELLARKIWDANLKYRGKVIIAIESLLGWCGLSIMFSQKESIQHELLLNGLYLLLVLISCEGWISRYLYLDNGKNGIGFEAQSLMKVMRFHAFDVEAYFALIKKSLWKLQILHALFWLLRLCLCHFFMHRWTWQRGLLVFAALFLALLCPYLLWWIKKKYYAYYLCHRRKTVPEICLTVAGVIIIRFLEVFPAITTIFAGGMFLSFSLGSFLCEIFTVAPLDEGIIWRRNYVTVFSLFICLVLMILVLIWAAEGYLFIKRRRTFAVICAVILVVMLFVSAIEANTYTDFYDGRIVSRNLWKVKEYQQKDIAHYRISAENSAIQMTLFMQDGEALKMATASFENSDLYDESYFGDYTYIADYVKELEEQGIPGELQDLQELQAEVKKLNKKEQKGLERIVQQLGESEGS